MWFLEDIFFWYWNLREDGLDILESFDIEYGFFGVFFFGVLFLLWEFLGVFFILEFEEELFLRNLYG